MNEIVNLYIVWVGYEYCYFVFAESRNKARSLCVNRNTDEQYIGLTARLLTKNVGGQTNIVVECEEDDNYQRVLDCGGEFLSEEYGDE